MADLPEVTIDCMYSCHLCGVERIHVAVRARTEDEGIVSWVKDVAAEAFYRDHSRRSPDCHPDTLSEVFIPTDGTKFIGGPAQN